MRDIPHLNSRVIPVLQKHSTAFYYQMVEFPVGYGNTVNIIPWPTWDFPGLRMADIDALLTETVTGLPPGFPVLIHVIFLYLQFPVSDEHFTFSDIVFNLLISFPPYVLQIHPVCNAAAAPDDRLIIIEIQDYMLFRLLNILFFLSFDRSKRTCVLWLKCNIPISRFSPFLSIPNPIAY